MAVTMGLKKAVAGRVRTMPNGIAVTKTMTAEMTTITRCSHVRLNTEEGSKVRASISSSVEVARQITQPTTATITKIGMPVARRRFSSLSVLYISNLTDPLI